MTDDDQTIMMAAELPLDPFAFHRNEKSAIEGLGGEIRPTHPGYAFHTEYVRVAEGPAHFTLRFQGLAAKVGTLMLRVHLYVEGPPVQCLVANTVRIQLNRLIQLGSETSIRFEGMRGVTFALYGGIFGESDARATGLSVTLDRPAIEEDDRPGPTLQRNTEFGTSTARPVPLLLATGEPTLARPVSQVATAAQLAEPACAEWIGRLSFADGPARRAWSAAYVLQALRAYGVWQEGASGVGFGADANAIARVLDQAGVAARTAELPDLAAELPASLGDVDFLWSVDVVARGGVTDAFGQIERLQQLVRPGGLAVHVVPFLPGREQRPETPAAAAFRRGEIERLGLAVIGRGDEVAQLRIDGRQPLTGDVEDGVASVGAFGMVIRKAPLRDR